MAPIKNILLYSHNLEHFILPVALSELNNFTPKQFIQLYYNFSRIKYRKAACTVFLMMGILFSKATVTKDGTTSK